MPSPSSPIVRRAAGRPTMWQLQSRPSETSDGQDASGPIDLADSSPICSNSIDSIGGNTTSTGRRAYNRTLPMSTIPSAWRLTPDAKVMAHLTSIGVTLSAFAHFVRTFIGHRFDYIRQAITGEWRTIRGRVF